MDEKLREYASLLVRVGLNVQKGQRLVISSPVECAYFARMCAQEAYDIGCKEVVMNWHDDAMARMKYLQADDAIFKAVRISGDGKAVEKWETHLATLHERMEKMNALNFKSLHYTNALGTDLTVELPEGHIWEAGNDVTLSGQEYIANIPTEELFTSPLKTGVNGVVYSAMPLVNDGTIID